MTDDYDVPRYRCGDCVNFTSWREPCTKRIDHEIIRHAKPWFKSYDPAAGMLCCEFIPKPIGVYAVFYWRDFATYWAGYVECWLPYQNTDILVGFTLHGDTSVRYRVPYMDYVNGTMIELNKLKAVEKEYYRRTTEGFGYKLIHEPINGIVFDPWEVTK